MSINFTGDVTFKNKLNIELRTPFFFPFKIKMISYDFMY